MRPFAQADGAVGGIEVVHAKEPDLTAGGRVEEGQDSEQCLVRVRVGAGGPAAEQLPLLIDGDGGADEPRRAFGLDSPSGVDEHDLAGADEAKVLPHHGQPALAGLGHGRQERFDVVDVGQGPVLLVVRAGQEAGEVADDARAASMVLSVRGRVPAFRARSRARSMNSANACTCSRNGSGVASMRRRRRPAASR